MSGKGWWNSAISGLESRLDTILADEAAGSTRPPAADSSDAPRSSTRTSSNARLHDRLAQAVTRGTERVDASAPSDAGSRPHSPATHTREPSAARHASDHASTPATEAPLVSAQPSDTPVPATSAPAVATPLLRSLRQSLDSELSRPSEDASTLAETSEPAAPATSLLSPEPATTEDAHDETTQRHRDELNAHLERIDALQTKLTYLAQQVATYAKAAATDTEALPLEKKLAERDAQIAALMDEGQRLSKTELKHLTTIKTLRAKTQEQSKDTAVLKQQLSKSERSITEQSERAKRAEAAERAGQERLRIVGKIEKDIEHIRVEREEAGITIAELRSQLIDAVSRAEGAEKQVQAGVLEAGKRATASLQEHVENLAIEKKLAEDRAKREVQALREEAKNQQDKANVAELELRGEIATLESKLEFLRSRTEEVTSSATGDSQAKLLRQIETLQTQYSLASNNWQGIETSLTSRVAALEKERDETAKRESDARRKARDVNSKARRLEDELESGNERVKALEHDLDEQRMAALKLQARLSQTESAAQDARTDLGQMKKVWEAEFQHRVEEERCKWKQETLPQTLLCDTNHLRADSPSESRRRHSPDPLGIYIRRSTPRSLSSHMDGNALPASPMDRMFDDVAHRPLISRTRSTPKIRTPEMGTPQRQGSVASLAHLDGANILDTPSVHTVDHEELFDTGSSPQRTINDVISASTAGAGPSVQLVERMSAAVRRLESEKAMSKEEMARLVSQRNEAREEVVALMREVDEKRDVSQKVETLEKDLKAMEQRYETTLEMLGEKTEKVDELEGDVADLKKIYKELVETMK